MPEEPRVSPPKEPQISPQNSPRSPQQSPTDPGAQGPAFDLDRLTLPPGMQRGNVAHGEALQAAEPPGSQSQSMLQPMSPAAAPTDSSMFGQVRLSP